MSTTTVKQAREAVEAALLAFTKADIEHPTATHIAKEKLNAARFDYHEACSEFCTKLEFATDLAEVHHQLIEQGIWA